MSHPQQQFFVSGIKQFLPAYFSGTRVLEIGSLNINGSVRENFEGCDYLGVDVGEGKDVDLVCHGEDFGEKANQFDVVISCEAMEHNPNWRKTWLNMLRLVKEDGLVVMSCATTGRRQHGTEQYMPSDSPLTLQRGQNHYRNLTEEDFSFVSLATMFAAWAFFEDHTHHDLYFYGVGTSADPQVVQKANELKTAFADFYYKRNILGLQ
jgi:SAM-dependent methyltransferase